MNRTAKFGKRERAKARARKPLISTLTLSALLAICAEALAADTERVEAPAPRPVPVSTCEKVGTNLWECCEENQELQQTICGIEMYAEDHESRPKPVLEMPRSN